MAGDFAKLTGGKGRVPGLRVINIGGGLPQSTLCFGAGRSNTEGNPATPSLQLRYPSVFKFRWAVRAGTRSIQVNVKQAINTSPRPQLIVRANPAIGVASDQSATAGSGTGWIVVGPVTVSPTTAGVLHVELVSNSTSESEAGCFFDHIVVM